jgi:hypothetical protein
MNELLDKQIDLWMNPNTGRDHERLLAEAYRVHTCHYAFRAGVIGVHDWRAVQATHNADITQVTLELPRCNEILKETNLSDCIEYCY